MKKIFLALIFLAASISQLFAGTHVLQSAASRTDIRQCLVMNQAWVPYPGYEDREGWDRLLGQYKDTIISNGEKYLDFDWKVLRATDYLEYNRTGNRYAQESRMKKNSKALSSLLIAELAEGRGRFMDDIINGVFLFCESTSWAVSDHLYKFQKVHCPLPDYKEDILALVQGNNAQMLSWAYYFFHKEFDKADPAIAERLEYEIRTRELDTYMQRDDFDWMGFKPGIVPNNWNPWCNSNAILCFMLIENDRDRLCAAIQKTIRSVDRYISSLAPDGACDEGPVYWYVSAGNLQNYLECLSLITGGRVQVWDTVLIRNFGEYIVKANITGNWNANFADAIPYEAPSSSKIYRFGVDTGSDLMKTFAISRKDSENYNPCDEEWVRFYNAIENLRCVNTIMPMSDGGFTPSNYMFYPQTEICFMRSGKGYLAAKGGNNKERHNHNDVGTFIYFYDNQPVFVDAGPGTYNKSTFDKKLRYKIWNMSSLYHNVPSLNGCAQEYGKEFKAVGTSSERGKRSFTTDIAATFPDSAAVVSCSLTYSLQKNGSLEIRGSYELGANPSKPCELHFLVPERPDVALSGKVGLNAGLSMKYDASAFEASYEEIPLKGTGIDSIYKDALYRITLKEKAPKAKRSYSLIVSK